MIFGTNSNYMLKYQKAKAKLVEYDIPQKDYPKFPLNSNELSYPVIYILSRYAESIIENDETGKAEFAPYMVKASQYFDASVGANDRTAYDADFLLSGAAAYFLSNDFGSSKVLCAALFEKIKDMPTTGTSQIILRNLLGYLLLDKVFPISSDTFGGEELCRALLFYYTNGKGLSNIEHAIRKYRTAIYKNNDPMEIYYVDILLAVITIALSKAAWKLIPQYSKLEPGQWEEYLKSSKSPKMLWPAQQLIGKKNVLSGENAIVQLPTGVGKTKSIELIIRSSFLSNRTATAIIVAPLRALCNEVASDMTSAFGESVLINQFSDILENDFFVDFTLKATILICTPEKLSYIIHHQVEFLDEIGLYIFDESHMFDDGRRGTAYELLISEIRKHINTEKQIVLLSAVLSNAEQIKQWLFNENGTLASDPAIKTTPKSIGFSSQTRDIHYYSEDPEREDFYVPRSIEVNLLKKLGRDDFEKVQEILTKNQKVFKTVRAESEQIRTEYQNDLAGMVFCADCGRSMDFDRLPHGAEESKKVCYYICRARQADDKCIGHQITEKLLKALVMDQLHLFIVRLSDKRKVLEELRKIEDMQNPVYRAKSEIMSLTDKVSQMAKKREQLYADYVAGVVDSEDYQLIREDYSKQYDGLRAALQRAEAKKVEVEQQIREYLNMTSNLEEHLDDFGFDAQLVKSLVQRIEVSADKRIRIVFGFQDVFADLGKESAGK